MFIDYKIRDSQFLGTQGTGAFFYEYWQKAISSDDVFEIDYNVTEKDETNGNYIFEKFKENADEIMKAPGSNGFESKNPINL